MYEQILNYSISMCHRILKINNGAVFPLLMKLPNMALWGFYLISDRKKQRSKKPKTIHVWQAPPQPRSLITLMSHLPGSASIHRWLLARGHCSSLKVKQHPVSYDLRPGFQLDGSAYTRPLFSIRLLCTFSLNFLILYTATKFLISCVVFKAT